MRTLLNDKASQKGVSLIELLTVLAIMSVVGASAGAMTRNAVPRLVLDADHHMFINDLRRARMSALKRGTPVSVVVEKDGYVIAALDLSKTLRRDMSVDINGAAKLEFFFLENGSTDISIRLTLSLADNNRHIAINALTGRVSDEK